MKVTVDRSRCTGLGICESINPGTFEIDDDDKLVILQDGIPDEDVQGAHQAVASCPTQALSISA
ncbi:ferredoxin [Aeromicrobium ginsengisoli]|uniref:Ferredoxin n=1 Tax=Aeromicrobium ginsengisoli TaxID=363867 RepID=A0A5M4FG09_9ACTN|nr:ferredoxin [Aeromicrobium ginsengisoli]KAA1397801.1 ferredoxin [Aeromicrobium ginsengisoli]